MSGAARSARHRAKTQRAARTLEQVRVALEDALGSEDHCMVVNAARKAVDDIRACQAEAAAGGQPTS